MHVNPENRQPRNDTIKHLFWTPKETSVGEGELRPFLYFEVRIDFNDVRTGFRETASLSKALEIHPGIAELLWTDDMIRDVDPRSTASTAPGGFRMGPLPEFVDANFLFRMESQFSQYLLRSFETRIYRNFDLNLYSLSGESRFDFISRCLELYSYQKRNELDSLHEIFVRKLEQARQKYLVRGNPDSLEETKAESRNKDMFSRCSERIADLFLKADLILEDRSVISPPPPGLELEDRLAALEFESRQAILSLCRSFEERAQSVDEYILHPNLKDIHFVRSCILWMPEGAA